MVGRASDPKVPLRLSKLRDLKDFREITGSRVRGAMARSVLSSPETSLCDEIRPEPERSGEFLKPRTGPAGERSIAERDAPPECASGRASRGAVTGTLGGWGLRPQIDPQSTPHQPSVHRKAAEVTGCGNPIRRGDPIGSGDCLGRDPTSCGDRTRRGEHMCGDRALSAAIALAVALPGAPPAGPLGAKSGLAPWRRVRAFRVREEAVDVSPREAHSLDGVAARHVGGRTSSHVFKTPIHS